MQKTKMSPKFWAALTIFSLIGQVAWVVENMYFNVFIYKMFNASASEISLMAQCVLILIQGVINVDDLPAGIAKNHVNALLNQGADEDIGAGKKHSIILSSLSLISL